MKCNQTYFHPLCSVISSMKNTLVQAHAGSKLKPEQLPTLLKYNNGSRQLHNTEPLLKEHISWTSFGSFGTAVDERTRINETTHYVQGPFGSFGWVVNKRTRNTLYALSLRSVYSVARLVDG